MKKIAKEKMAGLLFLVIALLLVIIAIANFIASTTGEITVNGSDSMAGLKCTDTKIRHPVFADVQPLSFTNTVTAVFHNDKLSSIMYRYDGVYQSESEASEARVLAEADYNLILANEYGAKNDIFTHTFMTNGTKLALTIADNANKTTSATAPYFLLNSLDSFPNTLETLQEVYEKRGFSCAVDNN